MKIYTKKGDNGYTYSKNTKDNKVLKCDELIEALGNIDELNSSLGLALAEDDTNGIYVETLLKIQNDLFVVGAILAGLDEKSELDIKYLEDKIDFLEEHLIPLKNFILPGGTKLAASLHNCRSICRRTERSLVKYLANNSLLEKYNNLIIYLNRLSDLLFVLARYYNALGNADIIWKREK